MSSVATSVLTLIGALFGGFCASAAVYRTCQSVQQKRRRRQIIALSSSSPDKHNPFESKSAVLRYAERLTREIFSGTAKPLFPHSKVKSPQDTRFGRWYVQHAAWAGCANRISIVAFKDTSFRMALAGMLIGALFGLVFSNAFALLLACVGAAVGCYMPFLEIRNAIKKRSLEAELHLSEMLQIVALGLRSGLTFDRSFALYGVYFDNGFARSCTFAYRRWTLGLCTREEALREFADSYDCPQLSRVVDSVLRSLQFGSVLADVLDEAGSQARAVYRARLEERVAKAPVKMMLPTGTLILPAMLLLVLGPVLLELIQGF